MRMRLLYVELSVVAGGRTSALAIVLKPELVRRWIFTRPVACPGATPPLKVTRWPRRTFEALTRKVTLWRTRISTTGLVTGGDALATTWWRVCRLGVTVK